MAMASCSSANTSALATNPPNDSGRPCLWMMVTATSVEADPIGVMVPPRLAPELGEHALEHYTELKTVTMSLQ